MTKIKKVQISVMSSILKTYQLWKAINKETRDTNNEKIPIANDALPIILANKPIS